MRIREFVQGKGAVTSPKSWLVVLLGAACFASALPARAQGPADQGYRKLSGREIRATFSGKTFSDGTHFSNHYEADGKIDGFAMGKKVSNTWKILGGRLCIAENLGELLLCGLEEGFGHRAHREGGGHHDLRIGDWRKGSVFPTDVTARESTSGDGTAVIGATLVVTAREANHIPRRARNPTGHQS